MKSVFIVIIVFLTTLRVFATDKKCEAFLTEEEPQSPYQTFTLAPKVYYLQFKNRREMAATFIRFQEHYESPRFRGKIFSRTQYKNWYRTEKNGHFSYYEDWTGFNIPSYVFRPFYDGDVRFKTDREIRLLEEFKELYLSGSKFYVIGAPAGAVSTLNHEIAHGLYYTNPTYKKSVDEVLESIDLAPIYRWLSSLGGYHDSVLADEAHAYLGTGDNHDALFLKMGIDPTLYKDAIQRLQVLFRQYYQPTSHLNSLSLL